MINNRRDFTNRTLYTVLCLPKKRLTSNKIYLNETKNVYSKYLKSKLVRISDNTVKRQIPNVWFGKPNEKAFGYGTFGSFTVNVRKPNI